MERYTDTISGAELYVQRTIADPYSRKRNVFYYKDRGMTILHRLDGPAYEGASGSKAWWVDGKRHRLDGPAYEGAYEGASGDKAWYVDGVFIIETNPSGKIIDRME